MKRGKVCVAVFALVAVACEPDTTTRVIDGEHVVVKGHRITLHQLDAPESRDAKCDRERQLAALTEERLAGLLLAARDVEFRKIGMACVQMQDCDGSVTADGQDVGDVLIAEGLAVRGVLEEGGGMTRNWCDNSGAAGEVADDVQPEDPLPEPPASEPGQN